MSCGRPISEALRQRIESIKRDNPDLECTLIAQRVGVSSAVVAKIVRDMKLTEFTKKEERT